MSFLVVGGLLAIGILALVVATFLGLGGHPEQAAATATVGGASVMGGAAIPVPPVAPPTIPLAPFSPTTTLTNNQAAIPPTHLPSSIPPPSLDGQLHEMAIELRTLHQEAHDIEHRLSTLREVVEHIEQSYRNHIGSFDDIPTLPEQ